MGVWNLQKNGQVLNYVTEITFANEIRRIIILRFWVTAEVPGA